MTGYFDDLITWNRGVHLRGTPLWVDPELKHELVCLTSPPLRRLAQHIRTLASPGVAAALQRLGARAPVLPAEFGRWIGIGGLQLQTVDLGLAPEGEELASGVLVGLGGHRLLFAGALRQENTRWPAAEHLVVRLVAPAHRGGDVHGALRAVTTFVRQAHADGVPAVLVVDALDLAGFLARQLGGPGGIDVVPGGRLAQALAAAGPAVSARGGLGVSLRHCDDPIPARGRLARIDTGFGEAWRGRAPDATFRVKWFADPPSVARMVRATGATGLTLIGATEAVVAVVREHVGPAVAVRALGQPRQLDLPPAGGGPTKLRD